MPLATFSRKSNTLGQTTDYSYDGFHHLASETQPRRHRRHDDGAILTTRSAICSAKPIPTATRRTDALRLAKPRQASQYEQVALSYNDGTHTETDGTATTSYIYDADNNRTETINPDGNAIGSTFDHLNRETQENWYAYVQATLTRP